MKQKILDLDNYLKTNQLNCYIVAEGKTSDLNKFLLKYNISKPNVAVDPKSVVDLGNAKNKDKWGLELRLYFIDNSNGSCSFSSLVTKNSSYDQHTQYSHRINNNKLIKELLYNLNYNLGKN